MSIPKGEYNGWKNWATWNVALWLGNDEGIYHAAVDLAKAKQKSRVGKGHCGCCAPVCSGMLPGRHAGHAPDSREKIRRRRF